MRPGKKGGHNKNHPPKRRVEAVEALYDGRVGKFEFHMAGKLSRLHVGNYVYTIWQDMLVGRCQITRIESGAVNPMSGKVSSLIFVKTPGDKLENPYPKKGHRSTHYYDGEGWEKP